MKGEAQETNILLRDLCGREAGSILNFQALPIFFWSTIVLGIR
jgi:hypothetical protein